MGKNEEYLENAFPHYLSACDSDVFLKRQLVARNARVP